MGSGVRWRTRVCAEGAGCFRFRPICIEYRKSKHTEAEETYARTLPNTWQLLLDSEVEASEIIDARYIVDNLKGLLHAFIYILHISSYIWLYTYARARCASYCIQHKYTISIHLRSPRLNSKPFLLFSLSSFPLLLSLFSLLFPFYIGALRALFFPLFSLFLCLCSTSTFDKPSSASGFCWWTILLTIIANSVK